MVAIQIANQVKMCVIIGGIPDTRLYEGTMIEFFAETKRSERKHRKALRKLLQQSTNRIRIVSAYVTETELLWEIGNRQAFLLTYLSRMDIVTGASSLDALATLIERGVKCRYFGSGPRLHAKVYLFDDDSAVITSANLTGSALDRNLEVGVLLSNAASGELIGWFESLWKDADVLNLTSLDRLREETQEQRAEYLALKKKVHDLPPLTATPAANLRSSVETADRFFVCNTNRKYDREDEERMHERGFAAAWETFNYSDHMNRVQEGDVIFMYAKGVGIIGVGRANGTCEILQPNDADRVTMSGSVEWRVPVNWLAWNVESPFRWTSPNMTFLDVSDEKYKELRDGLLNSLAID